MTIDDGLILVHVKDNHNITKLSTDICNPDQVFLSWTDFKKGKTVSTFIKYFKEHNLEIQEE